MVFGWIYFSSKEISVFYLRALVNNLQYLKVGTVFYRKNNYWLPRIAQGYCVYILFWKETYALLFCNLFKYIWLIRIMFVYLTLKSVIYNKKHRNIVNPKLRGDFSCKIIFVFFVHLIYILFFFFQNCLLLYIVLWKWLSKLWWRSNKLFPWWIH